MMLVLLLIVMKSKGKGRVRVSGKEEKKKKKKKKRREKIVWKLLFYTQKGRDISEIPKIPFKQFTGYYITDLPILLELEISL